MTQFLDIILPRDVKHVDSRILGEPQAKDGDDESVWTTEEDGDAEYMPIIDSSQTATFEGTGVAALAVVLLLGASLVAMAKLRKMPLKS